MENVEKKGTSRRRLVKTSPKTQVEIFDELFEMSAKVWAGREIRPSIFEMKPIFKQLTQIETIDIFGNGGSYPKTLDLRPPGLGNMNILLMKCSKLDNHLYRVTWSEMMAVKSGRVLSSRRQLVPFLSTISILDKSPKVSTWIGG